MTFCLDEGVNQHVVFSRAIWGVNNNAVSLIQSVLQSTDSYNDQVLTIKPIIQYNLRINLKKSQTVTLQNANIFADVVNIKSQSCFDWQVFLYSGKSSWCLRVLPEFHWQIRGQCWHLVLYRVRPPPRKAVATLIMIITACRSMVLKRELAINLTLLECKHPI